MSGDTGWKTLVRTNEHNFKKWGEYMKRAQIAERKLEKLKALVLLVDDAVSNVEMNELSAKQWAAFIEAFPDENPAHYPLAGAPEEDLARSPNLSREIDEHESKGKERG